MAIAEPISQSAITSDLGFIRTWVYNPANKPRQDNGELQFSRLLARRSTPARVFYEPWQFELEGCFSFRPDFWTTDERFYEITFLDRGIRRVAQALSEVVGGSELASRRRRHLARELHILEERWERKNRKVAEAKRLHGIDVGLVPYSLWATIVRDPSLLDQPLMAVA